VRTLPGKVKTCIFAVIHKRSSVHLTALSNLNRNRKNVQNRACVYLKKVLLMT